MRFNSTEAIATYLARSTLKYTIAKHSLDNSPRYRVLALRRSLDQIAFGYFFCVPTIGGASYFTRPLRILPSALGLSFTISPTSFFNIH